MQVSFELEKLSRLSTRFGRFGFFFLPKKNTSIHSEKTHSKKSASAALPELETRARCSPASVTAAARAEAAAASRRALVAAEGGIVMSFVFCVRRRKQFFFSLSSLFLSFHFLSLLTPPTL